MPPKQPTTTTTPETTAINVLISDTANPKQFSFAEHVTYFSLNFITKIQTAIQTAGNELPKVHHAIKNYANYLTDEIKRQDLAKEVTTQRCAYLINTISKLLELSISLENPLSNLINALAQHWLKPDSNDVRYRVQYFYNLVKILKNNTLSFTQFFAIPDVETLVHKKINALLIELSSNGNTQHIANVFLALGYLAQQGKTYNFPPETISDLLKKLSGPKTEPEPQHIANVFLSLGYLAQCSSYFRQPKMISVYETVCAALFKKNTLSAYSETGISQLIIAAHRIFHLCQIWILEQSDLKTLETAAQKEKPNPNALQLHFSKQLNELKEKTELEALICGFFVDLLITDRKIIIEFDGSRHYEKDDTLSIEDKMRDELLEKAGYTVIRFKNTEAKNLSENEKLLRERLIKITGATIKQEPTDPIKIATTPAAAAAAASQAEPAAPTPAIIQSQGLFKPKSKSIGNGKPKNNWHVISNKHK
jgi:very-short-patch-repair endonuclease